MNIHFLTAILGTAGLVALSGCVVDATPPTRSTVHTTYSPGYVTTALPTGYTTVTHRGTRYYVSNGVYYRPSDTGYVVVQNPL